MTTEVYEQQTVDGWVQRRLSELNISPSDLYFGSNFGVVNDDTESSTTLTTYQQKLRLTTQSLTAGQKYVVFWHAEVRANLQNKIAAVQVQLDDATVLVQGDYEGNEYTSVVGFYVLTAVGTGTHTVDIDYRAVDGTAYIRRARLLGWVASNA